MPNSVRKLKARDTSDFNALAPEAEAVLPPMPDFLSDEAKQIFLIEGRHLVELGILSEADGPTFIAYCEAVASLYKAFEEMSQVAKERKEEGLPIIYDSLFPLKLSREVRQLAAELGCTPVMRGKIQVARKDASDALWDAFDEALTS